LTCAGGFRVLQAVLSRLGEFDPDGTRTRWRKCSEITNCACARELARLEVAGQTIRVQLPVLTPDLTLRVSGVQVQGATVNGAPLKRAATQSAFGTGTYWVAEDATLLAFDPTATDTTLAITT
jgi:hypothetical protein